MQTRIAPSAVSATGTAGRRPPCARLRATTRRELQKQYSSQMFSHRRRSAGLGVFSVAQICNLPYRRIAFCGPFASHGRLEHLPLCRLQIGDTADCKSALRRFRPILNSYRDGALRSASDQTKGRRAGGTAPFVPAMTTLMRHRELVNILWS